MSTSRFAFYHMIKYFLGQGSTFNTQNIKKKHEPANLVKYLWEYNEKKKIFGNFHSLIDVIAIKAAI